MKTTYELECLSTGTLLPDENEPAMLLSYAGASEPALLRTVYKKKRLLPLGTEEGIYRYGDWLPLSRTLKGSSAPVTYRSHGLASALGLANLYITFSGYWPERDVHMLTGTFKECESYSVCARMSPVRDRALVVASAGNTARAFIRVCSENNIPLVVVVPEKNLDAIWSPAPVNPCVRVIAAGDGADYSDAIRFSSFIARKDGFIPEGGAKNVARRDGMGTTVLSAVTTIGRIPDYYFQAVGSGTGAIAAWEANQRFLNDGRFGSTRMRLMLSQNAPFLVIHDAWKKRLPEVEPMEAARAHELIDQMYAKVLSNRMPPYSLKGGLYDALAATDGEMYAVTNEEAAAACRLFEETESIDISPAAGVATASLASAVERGDVPRDATIMLNITGGGMNRLFREREVFPVAPARIVGADDYTDEKVDRIVRELFPG